GGLGLLAILVYPLVLAPSTMVTLTFGVLWCMVGVSLAVLTGWGGSISLGQFAIVGVGAMAAGNALIRWNTDIFASLAFSVAAGAIVSVLVGVPALRIRG